MTPPQRPFAERLGTRAVRGGDCVLLVDDDAVARLLTVSALGDRGWRVIEAGDGVEAL